MEQPIQAQDQRLPWLPVLMYHRVLPKRPSGRQDLLVTTDEFERQIRRVARRYETVTIDELVRRAAEGRLHSRLAAVTFDDGYQDTYRHAYPILQRYGVKATVYVVTSFLGGHNAWDDQRSPLASLLTVGQVREMAASGILIGSHTVTHPDLTRLGDRQLREELEGSKAILEDMLGREVSTFSYPFGYASPRVRRAVGEAGYQAACGIEDVRHGLFNISRVDASACRASSLSWTWHVSGAYFRLRRMALLRRLKGAVVELEPSDARAWAAGAARSG